ncbi:hypothetical protein [Streptomyces sp. NPDC048720]|uniref:hypothetical protein n=1 Tax=Streptomyces sp. NPDC048720 TaxID=3365588 RepID=UPI00371C5C47
MGTPIEGGEVQGGTETGAIENAPGPNPAWNDVLGVLPEQYHEVVTPHFQKWDQAAQQRIEQANQMVSQFEPYKPFVENNISPQDLEQGIQLMYQLNADPQAVYNALGEAYGFAVSGQQQQQIPGQEAGDETDDGYQDPRYDEIAALQQRQQEGLDLIAQTLLQQEQAKLDAAAEAEIDSELNALKQKHPGISEEFALSLMVNGFDANQVGERWAAMTQGILQQNPRPFAPNVMGTNGGGTGLPSQAIDPRKLDGKSTRDLVAQMVRAQMAE